MIKKYKKVQKPIQKKTEYTGLKSLSPKRKKMLQLHASGLSVRAACEKVGLSKQPLNPIERDYLLELRTEQEEVRKNAMLNIINILTKEVKKYAKRGIFEILTVKKAGQPNKKITKYQPMKMLVEALKIAGLYTPTMTVKQEVDQQKEEERYNGFREHLDAIIEQEKKEKNVSTEN